MPKCDAAKIKPALVDNLFSAVFLSEHMQCESRYLENPSTVHVTVSTGQVTV